MKRLGVYACIAVLVTLIAGGYFSPYTALADNHEGSTHNAELAPGAAAVSETPTIVSATIPDPKTKSERDGETSVGCSIFGKSPIQDCISAGVTWLIKSTLLQIAGFLVWLTANMLNYAIQISILSFSQWAPDSLYPIWIVVRQIVSLAVVFAGLYLGFMYIIGREDTFTRYIGWLVIFALFVNFSYPITRALVDVSNIVSLNVYSAAVGPQPLATDFTSAATTLGDNTAGALIMNRLGLYGLIGSATEVGTRQSGLADKINTVPGALVAVVFVFYAAYIFLMATGIIAIRTAVLVFLIVASPLLLVDSVIPKLGDAAKKLRQYFFQQLAVAPVFMIMLALTLKFMEVFQAVNPATGQAGPLANASGAVDALAGGTSIQVFFSILMMLIMLHIMIKVTKEVGGAAGQWATNMMGKVGGFGLGMATGGAGLLARGSIGAAAARWKDSDWMKNRQDTKLGRGLYTLSNSLAQSTFDARNIGLVSSGMQRAGLTSIAGVGMQKGLTQNYEQRFKAREDEMRKRSAYIMSAKEKEAGVRERYLEQETNTMGSIAQKTFLGTVGRATGLKGDELRSDAEIIRDKMQKDREKMKAKYEAFQDKDRQRAYLESLPEDIQRWIKGDGNTPSPLSSGTPSGAAPAPETVTAKKPNLDTTELDKAGLVGESGSTSSNTTQSPSLAVQTLPDGKASWNGAIYPDFASAAAAKRKYLQEEAARKSGGGKASGSASVPPKPTPQPPTSGTAQTPPAHTQPTAAESSEAATA